MFTLDRIIGHMMLTYFLDNIFPLIIPADLLYQNKLEYKYQENRYFLLRDCLLSWQQGNSVPGVVKSALFIAYSFSINSRIPNTCPLT